MNKYRAVGNNGPVGAASCVTVLRMCSDFRKQARAVCGISDLPLLNLALAYEDTSAGIRALRTFRDLFARNDDWGPLNVRNSWKFDFFRLEELREAAIAETVRADLVILSMNEPRELPAPVKRWIEESFERRGGDPGAVVLLHEGHQFASGSQPAALSYLGDRAQKAGLDFFSNGTAQCDENGAMPWHRAGPMPGAGRLGASATGLYRSPRLRQASLLLKGR